MWLTVTNTLAYNTTQRHSIIRANVAHSKCYYSECHYDGCRGTCNTTTVKSFMVQAPGPLQLAWPNFLVDVIRFFRRFRHCLTSVDKAVPIKLFSAPTKLSWKTLSFVILSIITIIKHDTQHNDIRGRNDNDYNNDNDVRYEKNTTVSIIAEYCYAGFHLCWVSFMPSFIYAECRK